MTSSLVNWIVDKNQLTIDKYLEILLSGSNDYSLNLLSKLGVDLLDDRTIDGSFKVLKMI